MRSLGTTTRLLCGVAVALGVLATAGCGATGSSASSDYVIKAWSPTDPAPEGTYTSEELQANPLIASLQEQFDGLAESGQVTIRDEEGLVTYMRNGDLERSSGLAFPGDSSMQVHLEDGKLDCRADVSLPLSLEAERDASWDCYEVEPGYGSAHDGREEPFGPAGLYGSSFWRVSVEGNKVVIEGQPSPGDTGDTYTFEVKDGVLITEIAGDMSVETSYAEVGEPLYNMDELDKTMVEPPPKTCARPDGQPC